MDVSKPSDLAVLTGGYFGRGMAKPSATCDGHQKKRGIAKRECSPGRVEGPPVYVYAQNMFVCVCSQSTIPVTKCGIGVMCHCHPQGLLLKFEISYFCKRQMLKFIIWQLLVAISAFYPHHYQYVGFLKAKLGCFGYCRSKPCLPFLVIQCACSFVRGLYLQYAQLMKIF